MKKAIPILLLISISLLNCYPTKIQKPYLDAIAKLELENKDLKKKIQNKTNTMDQKIKTFLTFQKGDAEQAMNLYINLFDNSKIEDIKRWGKDMPGKEGTVMTATFTLDGRMYMCSDSPAIHDWDFSPAVSNFVECKTEQELDMLFEKLSEKGQIMMPLNNYGFSKKFGWVADQFGVSWQLNLQ